MPLYLPQELSNNFEYLLLSKVNLMLKIQKLFKKVFLFKFMRQVMPMYGF